MALFRDVLNDYDLTDLGFTGLPFTYDNGKEGRQISRFCWTGPWLIQTGGICLVMLFFII
jgi:hypothetical protein